MSGNLSDTRHYNARDYLGYAEVIWDNCFPFDFAGLIDGHAASSFYAPDAWPTLKAGMD